jgi:hypothetical protein
MSLSPQNSDISIQSHTADVVDEPDFRVFDLDIAGFAPQL